MKDNRNIIIAGLVGIVLLVFGLAATSTNRGRTFFQGISVQPHKGGQPALGSVAVDYDGSGFLVWSNVIGFAGLISYNDGVALGYDPDIQDVYIFANLNQHIATFRQQGTLIPGVQGVGLGDSSNPWPSIYGRTNLIQAGTSTAYARVGGTLGVQTNIVGLTNPVYTSLFFGQFPGGGDAITNLPANFFESGRTLVAEWEVDWSSPNGVIIWTNQVRLGGNMIASNLVSMTTVNSVQAGHVKVRLTPIGSGASGRIRVSGEFFPGMDGVASMFIPQQWQTNTLNNVDFTAAQTFGVFSASDSTGEDYIKVTGGTIRIE